MCGGYEGRAGFLEKNGSDLAAGGGRTLAGGGGSRSPRGLLPRPRSVSLPRLPPPASFYPAALEKRPWTGADVAFCAPGSPGHRGVGLTSVFRPFGREGAAVALSASFGSQVKFPGAAAVGGAVGWARAVAEGDAKGCGDRRSGAHRRAVSENGSALLRPRSPRMVLLGHPHLQAPFKWEIYQGASLRNASVHWGGFNFLPDCYTNGERSQGQRRG